MHAVITFSSLPLWLGAVLSDWAYARTDQVQWTNFAAWLIAGGMMVAGIALLWALVAVAAGRLRASRPWPYLALLVTTLVLGFVNALVHARDAWAAMPTGLVLSAVVLLVAILASALGLAALRRGGAA
ncbi:DUF2231 domain-containing protein [Rhizobacter sp. LjRoot28]|jgi:uncharacterized membrane protein|uniref:DUF2231 domain-containing protein n=1 Tax=Rhizobacter sp. LjRoot28 TaxID=3342309 RepID=UPI003ECDD41E